MTAAIRTHAKLHIAEASSIRMIPLEKIRILNPRTRNQRIFAQLVENIASLGLKRPITVSPNGSGFDLICGQGRYEAFKLLGETEIPCVVVSASLADCYLISLVENLARRKHSNKDLLSAISVLSERGYSGKEIAQKTCLDITYIRGILALLNNGEERLIAAVEKGWLPITIATVVARADDAQVQSAMLEAYENGVLKGDQLLRVRRLIDRRRTMGKGYGRWQRSDERLTTPNKLLKVYQNEVRRQRIMVKKADVSEQRLLFVVSALRKLMTDEYFCTLLRSEGIGDMPQVLADRVRGESTQ
ncbi:plasmid partitioning protein RepB C-terminal domain-containing protein [Pseudomonas citronellolis]|uniref:plasmid partitioning protein RepB C-terminal domain-containing protein n=1 Tax=Pseudomonas citronellolis TaxID=53408 RepID=UPI0021BFAE94|nr:plasmid partitioning protein RepB C-terminal domain-containing protein [Pseudomonas citronellolis]UXJ50864.1 ParB N-terminal domain-containing protein [Pseudomonas citronellolis]